MNFSNEDEIREYGFDGFYKIGYLNIDSTVIPSEKGVYMVLFRGTSPEFLENGTCGFYKGKNPNFTINELKSNWVEDTIVLYIGKANNLQSRIKQYLSIGKGNKSPHWGGRLIWQLNNSNDLIVCWKNTLNINPREYESILINDFSLQYNKRPFANLVD